MITIPAAGPCSTVTARRLWLRWPLPALAAWAAAWTLFVALRAADVSSSLAMLAGTCIGLGLGRFGATRMRKVVVAIGFPLSLLASGMAAALPSWAWLLPLALLLLLYPGRAWRDAPLFPTPAGALDVLTRALPLPPGARVLDAGCGLGHGLRALRSAYPSARLDGVEWSWPLALIARAACPQAKVRRADLWAGSWADYDLVYLFQRPESMPRALDKARLEMRRGAWLASLEFEAAGWRPQRQLRCPDGRALWLYRMPLQRDRKAASSETVTSR
jgi:hypothetical protein